MALKAARFAGLLSGALSTGVFFGIRTAVSPSTKTFTPSTYVEYQQATIRNLYPVMGVLLPGAGAANLALLLLLVRDRRTPTFALTLVGLLCQLAAGALTRRFNFPINDRVRTWSPEAPPEGWEELRDRWEAVHNVRTAISVAGLASLLLAALSDAPNRETGGGKHPRSARAAKD